MVTTMEVALRRQRGAEELEQTLQICLSEARHMRLLVQGLMQQVRAEGTAGPEQVETFDATEMIDQCAKIADSLASERHVTLVRLESGKVPVRSEPARLRSVLMNLVSNAIEYNHEGGIVELSARRDNGSAEIIVKDDGPGIAPEHLGQIFQPFYRVEQKSQSNSHLGLGLFLVDSHVRAMGGECHIETALGKGTTFRIRVPVYDDISQQNGVK
jgi:signal transduction histidine kinase